MSFNLSNLGSSLENLEREVESHESESEKAEARNEVIVESLEKINTDVEIFEQLCGLCESSEKDLAKLDLRRQELLASLNEIQTEIELAEQATDRSQSVLSELLNLGEDVTNTLHLITERQKILNTCQEKVQQLIQRLGEALDCLDVGPKLFNSLDEKNREEAESLPVLTFSEKRKEFVNRIGHAVQQPLPQTGLSVMEVFGKEDMHSISSMINKCQFKSTADLWKQHLNNYVVIDSNIPSEDTMYFSYDDKGIFLNYEIVKKGSSIHKPYEVFFHESAHMLDWILGGYNNERFFSNHTFDGKRFRDVLAADAEKALASASESLVQARNTAYSNLEYRCNFGIISTQDIDSLIGLRLLNEVEAISYKSELQKANQHKEHFDSKTLLRTVSMRGGLVSEDEAMGWLAKEIHSRCKQTGLSVDDMFQATLGDMYYKYANICHPEGYYNSSYTVEKEAFASIMAARIANIDDYNNIKEYFPTSVAFFDRLIKEGLAEQRELE